MGRKPPQLRPHLPPNTEEYGCAKVCTMNIRLDCNDILACTVIEDGTHQADPSFAWIKVEQKESERLIKEHLFPFCFDVTG